MKKSIKEYFEINSKRLATIGVCTAVATFFGMFNYVTRLFPIEGFLTLEFSTFIYIVVLLKINLLYSILCVALSTWLRYLFVIGSEPIGLTSLMVGDCLFVTFISFFLYLFMYKKNQKLMLLILACILGVLLTSCSMVAANYCVFLDWYGAGSLKKLHFLSILFGFNLLKYFLNFIIFLVVHRVVKYLN